MTDGSIAYHEHSKLVLGLRQQRQSGATLRDANIRWWLVALTLPAYFVGCASSRASILPGNSAGQLADSQKAHVLAVGDEATIVTIDGAEYRGQVVTVSNAAVVLGRTSNAGYEEHQIESQSIEHIAWTNAGSIWPYLVAIGAGAVLWSVDQLSHID